MGSFFSTREKKMKEVAKVWPLYDSFSTSCTANNSKGKHCTSSLKIAEMLAYFASKQPFTIYTCNIVGMLYRR